MRGRTSTNRVRIRWRFRVRTTFWSRPKRWSGLRRTERIRARGSTSRSRVLAGLRVASFSRVVPRRGGVRTRATRSSEFGSCAAAARLRVRGAESTEAGECSMGPRVVPRRTGFRTRATRSSEFGGMPVSATGSRRFAPANQWHPDFGTSSVDPPSRFALCRVATSPSRPGKPGLQGKELCGSCAAASRLRVSGTRISEPPPSTRHRASRFVGSPPPPLVPVNRDSKGRSFAAAALRLLASGS